MPGALVSELPGHTCRIIGKDGLAAVIPLLEAHALAAQQVDGRPNLHDEPPNTRSDKMIKTNLEYPTRVGRFQAAGPAAIDADRKFRRSLSPGACGRRAE